MSWRLVMERNAPHEKRIRVGQSLECNAFRNAKSRVVLNIVGALTMAKIYTACTITRGMQVKVMQTFGYQQTDIAWDIASGDESHEFL